MPRSNRSWPLVLVAIPLLLVGTSLTALAVGGTLDLSPAGTMHVQVVDQGQLGVVAGVVTVDQPGFLGLGSTTSHPTEGWVVVHAEDASIDLDALTVVQDNAFTDPNGATWLAQEVTDGERTAWIVPIGEKTHDPTLESPYNFALVVDWTKVPQHASLTASYAESLAVA